MWLVIRDSDNSVLSIVQTEAEADVLVAANEGTRKQASADRNVRLGDIVTPDGTKRANSEEEGENSGDRDEERDYTKDYDEESFWKKVRSFALQAGKELIEKALILYYCLQDGDTPAWAKTVIIGALGYFIWPLDAIPDFTPAVGYADDLGVIVAAIGTVMMHIKPGHRRKAKEKMKEWFGDDEKPDDSGDPTA